MQRWLNVPLALFTLGIWAIIITWLRRRHRAGTAVLDLGRSSHQMVSGITFSVLDVLIGIWVAKTFLDMGFRIAALFVCSMMLSLSILHLFYGLSRLKIAEAGIFWFPVSLKWEWIASHRWGGKSGDYLVFTVRRGWLRKARLPWPISPVHRDAIEGILAQRLL